MCCCDHVHEIKLSLIICYGVNEQFLRSFDRRPSFATKHMESRTVTASTACGSELPFNNSLNVFTASLRPIQAIWVGAAHVHPHIAIYV